MKITYNLPTGTQIDLVNDMRTLCWNFGPFEQPVEELLQSWLEASPKDAEAYRHRIMKQCEFYADVLAYDEELQSRIPYDDLVLSVQETLLEGARIHHIKQLWRQFADVPVDDEDCITAPFLHFEIGTDRFDIWHWFDEKCPNGLFADLLYSSESDNEQYLHC